MPVATVVGGTPKLSTMPLKATGNEATLNDMIICPSAMVTIGSQDSRVSVAAASCDDIVIKFPKVDIWRGKAPAAENRPMLRLQASRRTGPFPDVATGTWR